MIIIVRKHVGIRQSGKHKGTLKRGYKYRGKKIVKVAGKQSGPQKRTRADGLRRARKPGPRISKSGKKYSERRTNRSDKNPNAPIGKKW